MPPALLGTNYDDRVVGKLPPVRVVNRYVESAQTNQVNGLALLPRPGKALLRQDGVLALRGTFREPGLFGGDLFTVGGSTLYREGVAVGSSIFGSDLIRWAGTDVVAGLWFCAGGNLYLYDGSTTTEISVPDVQEVYDVAEINGYILIQVANTGRRYFVRPGEITIDALDFFTSESSPDQAVATVTTSSEAWLFDQKSCEVWVPTGQSDSPFQRYEGRVFSVGATSRDSVIKGDNTIWFVGEDNEQGRFVYRATDGVPQIVSTNTINEKLRNSSANIYSIFFALDGHSFYIWTGDSGSFGTDVSTGYMWSEWKAYGRNNFGISCCASAPGFKVILGDNVNGNLYTLDPKRGNDNGDEIVRIVGGGLPTFVRQSIDVLRLQCNTGSASPPDYRPVIRARFSRDGGRTWGDERQASLGSEGEYGRRVSWRALGQFKAPGFLFELIDSDDVQTTLQYAAVNEPW